MGNVTGKVFTVAEVNACNVGSNTSFIAGPIDIMHLDYFSVLCITSATIAVNYSIQLSPYEGYGYGSAGANFTATSVPAASGADAYVTNKISSNHHAFLKIEASANSNVAAGDLRFVIHGIRR